MEAVGGIGFSVHQIKNEGDPRFRVGQEIEGIVVDVDREGLATVRFSGKTITVAGGSTGLKPGEAIQLKVTDISGGQVLAARIHAEETAVLHRLGMPLNPESLSFVEELLRMNQPIDKDLLLRLLKNSQEVRMLLSSGSTGSDLVSPIREILIRLFSRGASEDSAHLGASGFSSELSSELSSASAVLSADSKPISPPPVYGEVPLTNPAKEGATDFSGGAVESTADGAFGSAVDGALPKDSFSSDPVSGAASDSATAADTEQTDAAQSARLAAAKPGGEENLSADSAGNLRNRSADHAADHADDLPSDRPAGRGDADFGGREAASARRNVRESALQLLSGRDTLSSGELSGEREFHVRTLLEHFGAKENILLTLNRKVLSLEHIAAANLRAEDLADEFLSVAKSVLSSEESVRLPEFGGAKELEEAILAKYEGLKIISEATKLLPKQENSQIYYMPLPVKIGEEYARADLFYKKRGKKSDRKDWSILVSLRTHHIGEVRCLINRFDRDYVLAFALENESDAEMFRREIASLFEQIGFVKNKQILIRTREEVDRDFFRKEEKMSHFDLRV